MSRGWRGLVAAEALAGLGGLVISAYLTAVHYSSLPLACSVSGPVNCERVLTSPYAIIAGSTLPTSAAGVPWFAISLALALLQLRRPWAIVPAWLHLGWAAAGLVVVLYLVFVEIVRLGALCAWCTAAHALVLLTLLIAMYRLQLLVEAGGGEARLTPE